MTIEDRLTEIESKIALQAQFNLLAYGDYLQLAKAMLKMKTVQAAQLKLFSASPLMHGELKPEIKQIVAAAETVDEHLEAAAAKLEATLAIMKNLGQNPPRN